jgi:hypothetical protein
VVSIIGGDLVGAHAPVATRSEPSVEEARRKYTLDTSQIGRRDAEVTARPHDRDGAEAHLGSALAKALEGAIAAAQWGVVARIAKELEARRLTKEPNVVTLPAG